MVSMEAAMTTHSNIWRRFLFLSQCKHDV